MLSNFVDIIERETEIFEKFDADTLPSSIEDIIRFLFLCINDKAKSTDFTESIIDDDEVDNWWEAAVNKFSYTSAEIDDFKSLTQESSNNLNQTVEETNQNKTPEKPPNKQTSTTPGTSSNTNSPKANETPPPTHQES